MSDTTALMKTTNDPRQAMMIIACGYGNDEYYGGHDLWELTLMLTNGEAPKPKELIVALKAVIRQIEAGNCESDNFVATAKLPPQTTPAAPAAKKRTGRPRTTATEREMKSTINKFEHLVNKFMAEYQRAVVSGKPTPKLPK